MSKPCPSETPKISEEVIALVRGLRASGQLENAIAAIDAQDAYDIHQDEVWSGMNDSCKRRLTSSPGHSTHGFELVEPSGSNSLTPKQQPVTPVTHSAPKVYGGKGSEKTPLPEGIHSSDEWGRTLCTLPKVKDRKLRYWELVQKSQSDTELSDYLVWIKRAGIRSSKVDDLRGYMSHIGFDPEFEARKITYPGTSSAREF